MEERFKQLLPQVNSAIVASSIPGIDYETTDVREAIVLSRFLGAFLPHHGNYTRFLV